MAEINPHINFNGNAEEAFQFYSTAFGERVSRIVRFQDMAAPGLEPAPEEANKIMHIEMPIGRGSVLMGNDVPAVLGKTNERENRSKIVIRASSKDEATRLHEGLSAGGEVEVPIGDSPWGTYFGMFRDKYGIEWIVEFNAKLHAG